MAVQQLIWIVLIGAVLIAGYPVNQSPDTINEEDRLNYEKYVRQLEKKHKFAYNDIDQPWQSIPDDDSAQLDSHEIVLKQDTIVSVQPLVEGEVKQTSQSPVVVDDESPVTPVEDTPVVPVTKAEDPLVVTPVAEVEKEQQVADAISGTVAVTAEDEVATTTHDILLADEQNIPATTTHENLLGVADEVEGSISQSDPATEQESVTISQENDAIEDTTFSALKTDLVEETVTKVADDSDANEGSGQPLSDFIATVVEGSGQLLSESADEGSGQSLSEIPFAYEGSGAAATNEGSGLADELIKEMEHTVQPEIFNEESSTGTHFDLHLKDSLAFDSATTTTELLITDMVDEIEVKSTDTPTADEAAVAATTDIQPSSTVKSIQVEASTEIVLADSTDTVNDFRQDSVTASADSTELPEENTTFLNTPVNDEILADDVILKNTTEKPDSQSTPSDVLQ